MPDEILLGIINDHLPYEIDMLRGLFRQLFGKVEPSEPDQRIQHFAQIESFCIHARSLLDFFYGAKSSKDDDAMVTDFATGYTPPFDPTKEPLKSRLKSLRCKLNKQIFHLTEKRTIAVNKKFDLGEDGACVLQTIEPAIVCFTKTLKDEFKHFKCCSIPVDLIPTLGKANTTGSIYKT
jgi:hypothetical protein